MWVSEIENAIQLYLDFEDVANGEASARCNPTVYGQVASELSDDHTLIASQVQNMFAQPMPTALPRTCGWHSIEDRGRVTNWHMTKYSAPKRHAKVGADQHASTRGHPNRQQRRLAPARCRLPQ